MITLNIIKIMNNKKNSAQKKPLNQTTPSWLARAKNLEMGRLGLAWNLSLARLGLNFVFNSQLISAWAKQKRYLGAELGSGSGEVKRLSLAQLEQNL